MLLHSGEHVLRSAHAVLEPETRPSGVKGPGVLYLTNRRVLFEAPASGGIVRDLLKGPETLLVFEGVLAELSDARVRRPRFGRAWLVVATPRTSVAFDVLDPETWVTAIAQAKRALPAVPTGGGPTVIERQVVKVRCRYCGNLGNEVDGRCASCGAAL
jgi:hypothetical protein